MIHKFFRKYLSIIFIFATLLGVFHHHNDLKQHNDCQICTIQSSIANADTPVDVLYLSNIEIIHESILTKLVNLHSKTTQNFLNARAPPSLS